MGDRRTLTAIAAYATNRVIGRDNGMAWNLPEDSARFKRVTMGGVLVTGRRTHESIGFPLPGRVTVLLTRDLSFTDDRVRVVHSVPEAIEALHDYPERRWWVAGGGEIYRLFWDHLTDLDVTEVHDEPVGDVLFPEIDPAVWRETSRTPRDGFDFVEYTRITPPLPLD
ncbi:MAG TPA: dihydrofolate reductase [Propionibacteriaceae bacterium]|nr:dihydrofolate reductase [Propionibacteriaceae bacterium]